MGVLRFLMGATTIDYCVQIDSIMPPVINVAIAINSRHVPQLKPTVFVPGLRRYAEELGRSEQFVTLIVSPRVL